jgi:osmotically-inducible protein OsmY
MKTNETLQKDVQEAIKWEPLLSKAEIGVTAKDGIITLTGTVDSFLKKSEAEDAAKKISGVKAVVEKIEIVFEGMGKKDDNEIAKDVLQVLKMHHSISNDNIKVIVEGGFVILEGELSWNYQREAAKAIASGISGVIYVTNNIAIKSETRDKIRKADIERALARNSSIDEKNVSVYVVGCKVILNGKVRSWYDRNEAARIAWNAPGVVAVENELAVECIY